jgi:class 3 adenylate cyclase
VEAEPDVLTVLFTDIVGSTQLLSSLGDDAADDVRRTHFSLLRRAITDHRRHEVKSVGDGLMVAFPSARAAVASAVAMQQAVSTEPAHLGLRVGIDAGEPIHDGGDLYGTPVVTAKRLWDAAEGGQILVSDVVQCRIAVSDGRSPAPTPGSDRVVTRQRRPGRAARRRSRLDAPCEGGRALRALLEPLPRLGRAHRRGGPHLSRRGLLLPVSLRLHGKPD